MLGQGQSSNLGWGTKSTWRVRYAANIDGESPIAWFHEGMRDMRTLSVLDCHCRVDYEVCSGRDASAMRTRYA